MEIIRKPTAEIALRSKIAFRLLSEVGSLYEVQDIDPTAARGVIHTLALDAILPSEAVAWSSCFFEPLVEDLAYLTGHSREMPERIRLVSSCFLSGSLPLNALVRARTRKEFLASCLPVILSDPFGDDLMIGVISFRIHKILSGLCKKSWVTP